MSDDTNVESGGIGNLPEVPWVASTDNLWGIPVLDVRPVTLGLLSVSRNSRSAVNCSTYAGDYGFGFIGCTPPVQRVIDTDLRFQRDRLLADGALFIPSAMEHKWAIYFHHGKIIFVRSWLREVYAIADVEQSANHIIVKSIQGVFTYPDEEPELSRRVLEYILRSHALGLDFPAPIPPGMEASPKFSAWWCMTHFGRLAQFATPYDVPRDIPQTPLRTHSVLHASVVNGDFAIVDKCLASGTPIDLKDSIGLAPLHCVFAPRRHRWWQRNDTAMINHLLKNGCPVDVRSAEGATPLMNAVQTGSAQQVKFLLDRDADPTAMDDRGFTALHRAAEIGNLAAVRVLLACGASADAHAQGHTPLSLAQGRDRKKIITLLKKWSLRNR